MQSYEEAGGYGLPAYYDMSLAAAAATGYPTGSLMAAYGLPGSLAAASYGLAGLGGIPRRGAGVAGLAAARGGRGAMGRGGMRGRGAALAALGLGGFGGTGRGAGRGGGKMRGRGSPGGKRFNPLAPKPGNPAENDLGHIVFAYNIGENTTEEDVTALFSLYGTVAKVDVIWDYNKNITKGYAFVTMPNYEEAEYAISQLNGYNYAGKPLQVKFKTEKKAKNGDGDAE